MKKTAVLILAVLPIILLIIISFAGKIVSLYSYISVENVYFINEHEETLDDRYYVSMNKGEAYQTYVKVLPELATEKDVTYVSDNLDVCEVDSNGRITGVGRGSAHVNVITKDGNKIDTLIVRITDNQVSSVRLNVESTTLIVGETKKLNATIYPITALNKNISWTSSDYNVLKVDPNGYITALSPGEVEVFVITEDGNFIDICYVTCIDGEPPLRFDFSSSEDIDVQGDGYVTSTNNIDLKDFIMYDDIKIDFEDIVVEIESGIEYASISEDYVLNISSEGKIIKIITYVGDKEEPNYFAKVLIILR